MTEDYKSKIFAARVSLAIGALMLLSKIGAYIITGSAAIYSDAAESIVHILATAMALYSIILSSKPADESHPYGHGNIEFFSAGIEGVLILVAAVFIIFEALTDIIHGTTLRSLDTGIVIIASAGIINLVLGLYLVRIGENTNSLTLVSDGKHVLTDSFTSLGVFVGILLVKISSLSIIDPIVAIVVAINILFTGYRLVRKSVGGLMNETDTERLNRLTNILISNKKDYWVDIHELRFWVSGNILFIDLHLMLPYYFTIVESHKEEKEIEDLFCKEFPGAQIKIHFDYCRFELCKYCNYKKCTVRKENKSIDIIWDKQKIIGLPILQEIEEP